MSGRYRDGGRASQSGTKPVAALHFYAVLLRLYPAEQRRAFAAEMLWTFYDQYACEVAQYGRAGLGFWLDVIGYEARGIAGEHLAALMKTGELNMSARGQWLVGIGLGVAWLAVPVFSGVLSRIVALAPVVLGLAALVQAAAWLGCGLRRGQGGLVPLIAGLLKLDPLHNLVCGHLKLALQHLGDTAPHNGLSLGTLQAIVLGPSRTLSAAQ